MAATKTLADLKTYANQLLTSNPLLSARQRKDWQARVFFMGKEHIQKLIAVLEKNKNGLKDLIAKNFKKDPEAAKEFMGKFKSFKAKSMKKIADADHARDANKADEELTKCLNDI